MQTRGFSTLLIIIVVAVMGIAAVLAFGVFDAGKLKRTVQEPSVGQDQQLKELETVSTSDEVPDIERDINETNLETIDVELSEIEKEANGL